MKWPENCIIYVCVYNLSLADHSKLHAQISAQTACHLQPSQTRRYQSDWEFQDVHFHRNKIYGRHCISKSQSKCIIKFMLCRFRIGGCIWWTRYISSVNYNTFKKDKMTRFLKHINQRSVLHRNKIHGRPYSAYQNHRV